MSQAVRRPFGVTLVVILTWLAALSDLIGGGLFLWGTFQPEPVFEADITQVRIIAITMLVIGLITVAVAQGLAAGSQRARFAVYLLMGIRAGAAIYALRELVDIEAAQAWGQFGGAVLIILLLSTPKAARFFRESHA
ncbi:hypothetical protein [Demequina pelophila]|uniref:hypothetical protein n=1 Tax=Demequina pelophila TaxID=1638984 RepID=UPI0007854057|nr:hypothetical protein [Demequina pelophila]